MIIKVDGDFMILEVLVHSDHVRKHCWPILQYLIFISETHIFNLFFIVQYFITMFLLPYTVLLYIYIFNATYMYIVL